MSMNYTAYHVVGELVTEGLRMSCTESSPVVTRGSFGVIIRASPLHSSFGLLPNRIFPRFVILSIQLP